MLDKYDPKSVTARRIMLVLLAEGKVNEVVSKETCGPWYSVIGALALEHKKGGPEAMADAFSRLRERLPVLAELMTPEPGVVSDAVACPPLPESAMQVYQHRAICGSWLDTYIGFASEAASMTPPALHEAAGLFAVSTAIARRLVLEASTAAIYPNLFLLFIAPSTVYRKSTGLGVLQDLFRHAELRHLLLPQRLSPEALVQELGIHVPGTFDSWDSEAQEQWVLERAFAARRGWVIDEASGLFDGLRRDPNGGMLPLLLNLYECPSRTTAQTLGRGRTTVRDAYLSFFGATTPTALGEHLRHTSFWTNGLWARFTLLVPDDEPRWQFFTQPLQFPEALMQGLRRIYELFPAPTAEFEVIQSTFKVRGQVKISGSGSPTAVRLGAGVWEAWEELNLALHGLVAGRGIDPALHGSYGRIGTQAIKVAMLLATMDAEALPVTVELRHFARAQEIVERWRRSLHLVWTSSSTKVEAGLSDKVLALLQEAGPQGLLTRDIYRPLHLDPKEARKILQELQLAGQAVQQFSKGGNGQKMEWWCLARQAKRDLSQV